MGEAATENGVRKATSPEEEHPRKAFGWAARDASGVLSPFAFSRRNNGDKDVTIKILYCGLCHSDLHVVRNEWGRTAYPAVPGHEIVGTVTQVGRSVQRFEVGDRVAVGCMVSSCGSCHGCEQGLENHCPGLVFTYNSLDADGTMTYGGYSDMIVVDQHFVIRFPENMPSDRGAPLLCAGITVYAPMKHHGLDRPGKHLGVVGLGGLGHVAVRFGKAFGMKVTVISSSPGKEKEATERLGADAFLVSGDPGRMQAAMGSMDGIIDTVSVAHDITPLMFLLKPRGKLIMAGAPAKPLHLDAFSLILGEKSVAGTCAGGVKDTQEMIDFAAEHNIAADIELVSMDRVNEAMERLGKGDVRYRFVIDIGNTLTAA
ncbi:cinnamyl alcohol dehydrogenase [Musa troglodytarum]|uniref:cinnamyl-alcohol dehydrogenase n=1 Tax=Musa troglodytarum TaxID=320322 RepID=A0A9E7HU29_9LILI|nr:cinnamyl alcohol dehydrogenase [Musa troglodytarum]